jgi:FMN-dependent NADH-azoreductase
LSELGRPTLAELLAVTGLIARNDPSRHERVAASWLFRYLQEHDRATITEAVLAAAALAALSDPTHDDVYAALQVMAERASRRPFGRGVT